MYLLSNSERSVLYCPVMGTPLWKEGGGQSVLPSSLFYVDAVSLLLGTIQMTYSNQSL